jgi:hypothetical protein
MMPSQTFNLSGVGAQNSATITVGAGEKVRVRLSGVTERPGLFLVIVANSVTTLTPVDQPDGWVTLAVMAGDVVNVRMNGMRPTDNVVGVLESGA